MTGPADQTGSAITGVELSGVADAGVFGGVAYERRWGVLHGAAAVDEDVVGLAALPVGADGRVRWTSEFEVVAPAPGQPGNDVVLVEAENRGSPRSLARFNGAAATGAPSATPGAPAVGGGFLFRHRTSYGRVQWQTGLSAGVPAAEDLAAAWGPDVRWCIETFGPQRCMFESNFPPDSASFSYPIVWNAFERMVAGASEADKAALFHDTAVRTYRLDG